jgi:hypothetical protein
MRKRSKFGQLSRIVTVIGSLKYSLAQQITATPIFNQILQNHPEDPRPARKTLPHKPFAPSKTKIIRIAT